MIKKIMNIFGVIIIVLTAVLWIYTDKKGSSLDLKIYAVKTNYQVLNTENKTVCIPLFLNQKNNIVSYGEENSYFLCNENEQTVISLKIINVKKEEGQKYKDELVYPYLFNFEAPALETNYSIENAYLKIVNASFKVKIMIGTFTSKNVMLNTTSIVDYSLMYGIYNEYDKRSLLVGIVLELNNKTSNPLSIKISSSNYFSFNLSKAIEIKDIDNEQQIKQFIPDYSPNDYKNNTSLLIQGKQKYLIPIGYLKKYYTSNLFLQITIQDEVFYIDNFTFQSNIIQLQQWQGIVVEEAI